MSIPSPFHAVEGVPYYITVTPVDQCLANGNSITIVDFTKELS